MTVQPEQIYRTLQQQPFRPMRVFLKDGRTYDIPLRELAVVGVTYLDIGIQSADAAPGIAAGIVTVTPEEIVRIEPMTSASVSS
jgi:hypothetical protein